jgi:hypothetical protein
MEVRTPVPINRKMGVDKNLSQSRIEPRFLRREADWPVTIPANAVLAPYFKGPIHSQLNCAVVTVKKNCTKI